MTKWAYIENNEIKGTYDRLPTSWKNISGFNYLQSDLEQLKSLGWHSISTYLQYDRNLYNEVGYTFDIVDGTVVGTPILKEIVHEPEPVIVVEDQTLSHMRNERDGLLKQSDIYQLADWQTTFSADLKLRWLEYRAKLRDMPQVYADTNQIVWPLDGSTLLSDSNSSMSSYISNLYATTQETIIEVAQ